MRNKKVEITELYRKSVLLADREIYPNDCWAFLSEQAYTLDEASQQVRKLPDFDYLHDLIDILESGRNLIAIPKSRRMMVTWIVALWIWWKTRYHPNHFVIWQSLTEEKAAEVVENRIVFAEKNMRDKLITRSFSSYKTKEGMIGRMTWTSTGSRILAASQGPHVFRSYTPSIAIIDEADFQPEAYSALEAALPLAEKNATIILISSSNGPGNPIADLCASFGMTRYVKGF